MAEYKTDVCHWTGTVVIIIIIIVIELTPIDATKLYENKYLRYSYRTSSFNKSILVVSIVIVKKIDPEYFLIRNIIPIVLSEYLHRIVSSQHFYGSIYQLGWSSGYRSTFSRSWWFRTELFKTKGISTRSMNFNLYRNPPQTWVSRSISFVETIAKPIWHL